MASNIKYEWSSDEKTLIVTIDATRDEGKSSSGKSTVIASSHGAIDVGNDMQLNLNLYKRLRG